MTDRSSSAAAHRPAFSLARSGVTLRLSLALGLIVLVWLAILPLVLS